MFSMDFTDVGNPCILGMLEDTAESNVDDLISFVHNNEMDGHIFAEELERLFDEFDINYSALPDYLKAKIDTIDILE